VDIHKIKIEPKADGGAVVHMDDNLVERFKLFCLVDFYLAKPVPNWILSKAESHPDGRVILHITADRNGKH
jgi:hypothetical protein